MTRLLSAFLAALLLTAATATIVKADPPIPVPDEVCYKKPWNC